MTGNNEKMEINFRKSLNGSYLAIGQIGNFNIKDFELKMVLRNSIPGLLAIKLETVDAENTLLYDVTSRQPFEKLLEAGKITMEIFKALAASLKICMDGLNEFLLDPGKLVLRMDSIFADDEGKKYWFCYNPFYRGSMKDDLSCLMDRILTAIDYENPELVRIVYELRNKASKGELVVNDITHSLLMEKEENLEVRNMFNRTVYDEELTEQGDYQHGLAEKSVYDLLKEMDEDDEEWREQRKNKREFSRENEKENRREDRRENRREVGLDEYDDDEYEDLSFMDKLKKSYSGKSLSDILRDINDGIFMENIRNAGMN